MGAFNENIVIKLGENSTIIKENSKILATDSIDFISGKLYYYLCPIPKSTVSLTIDVA